MRRWKQDPYCKTHFKNEIALSIKSQKELNYKGRNETKYHIYWKTKTTQECLSGSIHNYSKLGGTKIFFNKCPEKQTEVHPSNGLLLGNKREQTTDLHRPKRLYMF